MLRKSLWTVICLLAVAASAAQAQQAPPTYTFVAEWLVERPQWEVVNANFEKNIRPALDRLMANGTITGWGTFVTAVHTMDGPTHGTWFQATSVAAIQRAFEELVKLPTPAAQNTAKHWDYLLRAAVSQGRTVSPATGGYLMVSSQQLQPGKGAEWLELWNKHNKPIYDELLANGTITSYAVETEYIHTQDPNMRHVVYTASSADAVDKVNDAFTTAFQKRSAEENRAIGAAFTALQVPGSHRDAFARILSYARK